MTKHPERQYLNVLKRLLKEHKRGRILSDRTGTGVVKVPGAELVFTNIHKSFPAFTSRKTYFKVGVVELLWMMGLLGDPTNIRPLVIKNINIWNEWPMMNWLEDKGINPPDQNSQSWKELSDEFADKIKTDDSFAEKFGSLGPTYGAQMTAWKTYDGARINQIQNVIEALKENSFSRRINISLWNVAELGKMALPPCLFYYQFMRMYADPGEPVPLVLITEQRSADWAIGTPHNVITSALLLTIVAMLSSSKEVQYVPHMLKYRTIDTHLYINHVEGAKNQLSNDLHPFGVVEVDLVESLDELKPEHFRHLNYKSSGKINYQISV